MSRSSSDDVELGPLGRRRHRPRAGHRRSAASVAAQSATATIVLDADQLRGLLGTRRQLSRRHASSLAAPDVTVTHGAELVRALAARRHRADPDRRRRRHRADARVAAAGRQRRHGRVRCATSSAASPTPCCATGTICIGEYLPAGVTLAEHRGRRATRSSPTSTSTARSSATRRCRSRASARSDAHAQAGRGISRALDFGTARRVSHPRRGIPLSPGPRPQRIAKHPSTIGSSVRPHLARPGLAPGARPTRTRSRRACGRPPRGRDEDGVLRGRRGGRDRRCATASAPPCTCSTRTRCAGTRAAPLAAFRDRRASATA